jgi:hypothetical protein
LPGDEEDALAEERKSFRERLWERLFGGSRYSARQEKVLTYIIGRLESGASLDDVVQEEYVRRQASPQEVDRILSDPEIIESARKRMHEDFGSEGLRPGGKERT